MANIITVAYPEEADAPFNEDYYIKTHMPLVQRSWQQYGLESWAVRRYYPTPEGAAQSYRITCDLVFRDEKALADSMQSAETAGIVGDVVNFTTLQPTFWFSSSIGSSS